MKTLGILGGMGPMATVDFYKKVVSMTAVRHEADHLHIIIDSNPHIPDRTKYILGDGKSPKVHMIKSLLKLEALGAEIIVMPCNTAHYFYNELIEYSEVPFLNMIHETANYLMQLPQMPKKVGLLATTGTYASGIYSKMLGNCPFDLVIPEEPTQKSIMQLIYKVKSGNLKSEQKLVNSIYEYFMKKNVEALILGCTELPIVFEQFGFQENVIDPTAILARAAILSAGGKLAKENNTTYLSSPQTHLSFL